MYHVSCHTWMSHVNLSYLWMSHVTRINMSCLMSHIRTSHENESCHTYEDIISCATSGKITHHNCAETSQFWRQLWRGTRTPTSCPHRLDMSHSPLSIHRRHSLPPIYTHLLPPIYTHVYTHIYIHDSTCAYIYMYAHINVHTGTHRNTHIYAHARVRARAQKHKCMHTHTNTHTHTRTHTHSHPPTRFHIHTHSRACSFSRTLCLALSLSRALSALLSIAWVRAHLGQKAASCSSLSRARSLLPSLALIPVGTAGAPTHLLSDPCPALRQGT